MFRYTSFILLLTIPQILSLPDGAPRTVCDSMMPFHSGGILAQASPPPFGVFPEVVQLAENSRVRVNIGSQQNVAFAGFMLQARTANDRQLVGSFTQLPAKTKTLDCERTADSVTHSNPESKGSMLTFEWQPPTNFRGTVIFNSTIAQNYATFWVGLESEPVRVMRREDITNPAPRGTPSRTPPQTTPPHFIPTPAQRERATDDPFYNGCFDEKGCFGVPEGCVRSKDCDVVVANIVKGENYEFEIMSPLSKASYVAVGLSDDDKMGDDSVIECVKEGNTVNAYMSRTIPRPNLNVERLARPKEGIEVKNFSLSNGELYCRVARDKSTLVNGKIYDLVKDTYYLLVVSGTNASAIKVGFHDIGYIAAGEKRYLTDVSELGAASKILLRLHGAFMLVAWVGTASAGILLARYYRQTWVGSQICGKDLWFAWHRFFMVLTWSLTMVAFILIFVELKAWTSERNPHAILGTITTIICFLQPIGAFFRPHPGTPKRAIFNWLHWFGGNVAHILGIVTIFFAVKLNKAELPEWMDWILVAYVAFHVLIHLVLSLMSWMQILGCVSDRTVESRVTSFPMKDLGANGRTSHNFDSNPDAPKSGLRKFILGLYLFVIILFVIALIVIIVLAPVEQTWKKWKRSMSES